MAEMIKKRTGNNKAEWSEDALHMLKELATAKVQGRPRPASLYAVSAISFASLLPYVYLLQRGG